MILYTRVSTDEQAEKGYSLRDQEARLRRYCEIQGHTVAEHFQDDASAKTFERPAFQQLLAYIKQHRHDVDAVLFVKWDRFSRNAEAAYAMIRRLSDWGVEVQAVEQPVDVSVPENKLMLAFYLAAPEVENERRALNTKMGMRRAMREGRHVSGAPKGYRMGRDEGNRPILMPDENARHVRDAFAEVAKGVYSAKEVLLKLRKRGFKCSVNQFGLLLRNPLYSGRLVISAWRDEAEEIVQGVHEPLVDLETFERVQAVLEERKGRPRDKPSQRREELPLRGFLECKRCGRNLTGSAAKGNGGTYFYYHCQKGKGCGERFRADEANERFVERLRSIAVAPEVARLHLAVMEDIFSEKEGSRGAAGRRRGGRDRKAGAAAVRRGREVRRGGAPARLLPPAEVHVPGEEGRIGAAQGGARRGGHQLHAVRPVRAVPALRPAPLLR